jgi:hypothetical protein
MVDLSSSFFVNVYQAGYVGFGIFMGIFDKLDCFFWMIKITIALLGYTLFLHLTRNITKLEARSFFPWLAQQLDELPKGKSQFRGLSHL